MKDEWAPPANDLHPPDLCILRSLTGASHHGQPEALPAPWLHGCLQLLTGGTFSLHCL